MNFNAPSFFAGIAATAGILALGFGGGVMVSGMLSGGSHPLNKIERQAAAAKEPTEPNPVVVAPQPPASASNAGTQSASTPPQVEPPLPPAPAQPGVKPEQPAAATQPLSPQSPTPALQSTREAVSPPRDERPAALEQPEVGQIHLSRRELRRLMRQDARRQREEWRKQMAERRRQDDLRRREQHDAERAAMIERRPSGRDADEDEDDLRRPVRPALPFGLFR